MLTVRKASDRGHADHGWLKTYHTFSFADYQDPAHHHFRALRVMNEDWIAAGQGFGMHGHRDMEIVTYVLDGVLAHQDSLGNGEELHAGEFQRMSAGTGILHSEFNPSAGEPVHLYQIWLFPEAKGLEPSYEQKRFADAESEGRLRLVASPDAAAGSLKIHQNVRVYLGRLQAGQAVTHPFADGRFGWVQVLRGAVTANGLRLETADGVAVSSEATITLASAGDESPAEVLLFDLP